MYYMSSIDGIVETTPEDLARGVGADWSDVNPIPVFNEADERVGEIDPYTGEFSSAEYSAPRGSLSIVEQRLWDAIWAE